MHSIHPIRVLMAVPKYPLPVVGGLERQAHELARALTRRGHSVHVISNRFDSTQDEVAVIDGVRVHRVPWIEQKLIRFLLSPLGLARILISLRKEVDLVHVHNLSWFGAFVTLISKALGLPVITKLPGNGVFGIPGMLSRRFGSVRLAGIKRSDAIVALAPQSVEELAGIGYPAERVLKVPNGIPVLEAGPALPLHRSVLEVVFVGRLSAEKGLFDILHAWSIVRSRSARAVRLRVIGDGPQEQDLRDLTSVLEIDSVVEFFGYCDDVPKELAHADVFVLGSYAEGNSNSVLEAMRAGLPVVATAVGGTSMQVGREGERFLVTPGARQALAEKLLELIEDESLRLRTGAAMRTRIESVFEMGRVAATYEQAYRLILSGDRDRIGEINSSLFQPTEPVNV